MLTICYCPCIESSLVLLEERVCCDYCVLLAKLLAFTLLLKYSKAKLTCYPRYLLTSYFCIPIPYDVKDIFFLVLILEGLVGFIESFNFSFFGISGWGI